MAEYKQQCRYCSKLIEGDSEFCPYCGKTDPFVLRCPMCRNPVKEDYMKCNKCGFTLRIICPACHKETFAGLNCTNCNAVLLVECKNKKCGYLQLATNEKCVRCNKKL